MKPRKVVIAIGLLVLVTVLLICGLMYTSDSNTYDSIIGDFRRNTQSFEKTSVSTIVEQIDPQRDVPPVDGNWTNIDTSQVSTWLDACELAHHSMFHAGIVYQASGDITLNGFFTEADCTGYIGVALYLYGLQQTMSAVSESSLDANSSITNMGVIPKSDYQSGDILVYNDHVEVYVSDSGNGIAVYQWGNSSTAEGLYIESVGEHSPKDCTADIKTTSSSYGTKNNPVVYRLSNTGNASPPSPPKPPQPDPGENLPGVPVQPNPGVDHMLQLPLLIKQGNYPDVKLGTSSKTVSAVGCFASSMQMVANYMVSPNMPWTDGQIRANFKLDFFNSGGGCKNGSDYMKTLTNGAYGLSGDNTPVIADIEKSIDSGRPVIMHFTSRTEPYYSGTGHFLVIRGYDDSNFYLADPGAGLQDIPKSELTKRSTIKVRFLQ